MDKIAKEEMLELIESYIAKQGYEDRITELEKEAGVGQTIGRGKAYVMKAIQKALSGAGQGIKRGAGAVDTQVQRLGERVAPAAEKVPVLKNLVKRKGDVVSIRDWYMGFKRGPQYTSGTKRGLGAGVIGAGAAGAGGAGYGLHSLLKDKKN